MNENMKAVVDLYPLFQGVDGSDAFKTIRQATRPESVEVEKVREVLKLHGIVTEEQKKDFLRVARPLFVSRKTSE